MKVPSTHRLMAFASTFAFAGLSALSASTPPPAWKWTSSGGGGGGTATSVAVQPGTASPIIVVGGDVFGLNRSTDGGKSWEPDDLGFYTTGTPQVACVMWDPTIATTAYAATNYGFYESTDSTQSWALIGTDGSNMNAVFSGNGGSISWPRPVGNLIAIAGGHIYAGCTTVNSGALSGYLVCASYTEAGGEVTIGGWQTVPSFNNLTADGINSVAVDPNNPDTVFVATNGNGVLWSTNCNLGTDGTWATLATVPAYAQSLLTLNSDGNTLLYAGGGSFIADGTSGTVMQDSCTGGGRGNPGSWTDGGVWMGNANDSFALDEITPTDSSDWTATPWIVGGYVNGNTVTIYAGASNPQQVGGGPACDSLMETTDNGGIGGNGWTSIATTTVDGNTGNVGQTVYDSGGVPYWVFGADDNYTLGKPAIGISNFGFWSNPSNGSYNIVMACQNGPWGTTDAANPEWYSYTGGYYTDGGSGPIGGGYSSRDAHSEVPDPTRPGVVYAGSGDWSFLYSTDGGATWAANSVPGQFKATDGREYSRLFADTLQENAQGKSPMVYAALQDDAKEDGTVMFSADPTQQPWQPYPDTAGMLNLQSNKVQGVVSGQDSDGHVVVMAMSDYNACSTGSGIYCIDTGGGVPSWSLVCTDAEGGAGAPPDMYWYPKSKYVYAYGTGGPTTGLYYSKNYGLPGSWSQEWTDGNLNMKFVGHMVADPGATDGSNGERDTLYLSDLADVWIMTDASSGTSGAVPMGFVEAVNEKEGLTAMPGPVAFSNGCLYVATETPGLEGTDQGELWVCQAPASRTSGWTWTKVSGSGTAYPEQSNWTASLAKDSTGTLYVGNSEDFVALGAPVFADSFILLKGGGKDANWNPQSGEGVWGGTGYEGLWQYAGSGPYYYSQSSDNSTFTFSYLNPLSSWPTDGYTASATMVPTTWSTDGGSDLMSLNIYCNPNPGGADYSKNRYFANIQSSGGVTIKRETEGVTTTLVSQAPFSGFATNGAYVVALSAAPLADGDLVLTMYVNGVPAAQATDASPLSVGTVALGTVNAAGVFSNVSVTTP